MWTCQWVLEEFMVNILKGSTCFSWILLTLVEVYQLLNTWRKSNVPKCRVMSLSPSINPALPASCRPSHWLNSILVSYAANTLSSQCTCSAPNDFRVPLLPPSSSNMWLSQAFLKMTLKCQTAVAWTSRELRINLLCHAKSQIIKPSKVRSPQRILILIHIHEWIYEYNVCV